MGQAGPVEGRQRPYPRGGGACPGGRGGIAAIAIIATLSISSYLNRVLIDLKRVVIVRKEGSNY
jgi:hypothetical protein